mgnify:CR=1 FL=1
MDDLCGYSGSNLQRIYSEDDTTYSTTSCPNPGLYQLDTYFIVPGFTQDQELHYTPDIRFRLYSARGRVLGCATTGTYAQGHMARQHAKDGLFALSVAFCVLCCVFSTLIYLNYGRERRLLAEKLKQRKQQQLLERANDNDCAGSTHLEPMVHTTKMAAAAGEANHDHDHAQRYHYFEPPDEAEFNGSSNASQTSNGESSSIDTRNYPRRI